MTLAKGITPKQLVTALILLKNPRLEGRITVVVRRSPAKLYRAARCGRDMQKLGIPPVKLTFMADLSRPDLQDIVARAATAAYEVATLRTNANALEA